MFGACGVWVELGGDGQGGDEGFGGDGWAGWGGEWVW